MVRPFATRFVQAKRILKLQTDFSRKKAKKDAKIRESAQRLQENHSFPGRQ